MDTKSLEGCCLSKTVLCHMESSPTTSQPKERISRSHDRSLSAHLSAVPLWECPTKEQWETMAGLGKPKQTMLLLLPGPSQKSSTHQRPISTSPEEHRNTRADRNPNQGLKGRDVLSRPLLGLSQETLSPASICEISKSVLEKHFLHWGVTV